MLNGRRTFVATRGILKNKSGYDVTVPLPEGGTLNVGTFTNNVTAALAHDAAVREHWDPRQAEDMVNLCKSNTELLALDAKTTKAFTDEYTRDVAVENYDKLMMQEDFHV